MCGGATLGPHTPGTRRASHRVPLQCIRCHQSWVLISNSEWRRTISHTLTITNGINTISRLLRLGLGQHCCDCRSRWGLGALKPKSTTPSEHCQRQVGESGKGRSQTYSQSPVVQNCLCQLVKHIHNRLRCIIASV